MLSIRNSILTEEFDYNFLKYLLHEYKNPRVKIHDLLKKGLIIRVKKGLYVFGPEWARQPYSNEVLANLIYGPSYISLEYALYYYDLIPERVETVTSITNKRKKFFNTPVGAFSYRYINSSIYPYGITVHDIDKYHSILIATREKALSDMLYFQNKINNVCQIEEYLLDNLRIEKTVLAGFDMNKVKVLARYYGGNVSLLYKFLEELK